MKIQSKGFKRIGYLSVAIFLIINVVAYFHAYKFTHFSTNSVQKTKNPEKLKPFEKLKTLLLGVNNPRPENKTIPHCSYKTIRLKSNKEIECWQIPVDSSKGTVIIFHGFSGYKSSMLDKSNVFNQLGYSTLLVDFMGSGGSEGNQTTIGYDEATQVKTAFEFIQQQGEKKIFLFGTSMGAVAIMKALNDYTITPTAIILECPFGTMQKTVEARFTEMKIPSFPMAYLLMFWGGTQNGFNAFAHNPEEYAKKIITPTLLLYGKKDKSVSITETQAIYTNLRCKNKELEFYENAGHDNYLVEYKPKWIKDVKTFLAKY